MKEFRNPGARSSKSRNASTMERLVQERECGAVRCGEGHEKYTDNNSPKHELALSLQSALHEDNKLDRRAQTRTKKPIIKSRCVKRSRKSEVPVGEVHVDEQTAQQRTYTYT